MLPLIPHTLHFGCGGIEKVHAWPKHSFQFCRFRQHILFRLVTSCWGVFPGSSLTKRSNTIANSTYAAWSDGGMKFSSGAKLS